MARLKSIVGVAAGALAITACSWFRNRISPAQAWQTIVLQALVGNDTNFQAMIYPTTDFGIGTFYAAPPAQPISLGDEVCESWLCMNSAPPTSAAAWLSLDGLAIVGTGGAVTLSSTEADDVAVQFAIPTIKQLLSLGGGASSGTWTKVSVTIGSGAIRSLPYDAVDAVVKQAPLTSPIGKLFAAGNLAVVRADVVLDSLAITVSVADTISARLNANFFQGKATAVVGDSVLHGVLSRSSGGNYTYKIDRPVIVGRRVVRQPGPGLLSANRGWDAWTKVATRKTPPR